MGEIMGSKGEGGRRGRLEVVEEESRRGGRMGGGAGCRGSGSGSGSRSIPGTTIVYTGVCSIDGVDRVYQVNYIMGILLYYSPLFRAV